jgi:hypothetical protein
MLIDSLYKDYFQKSKIFLYTLLGIKRGATALPEQTYLAYEDFIRPEHRLLVCRYTKRTDEAYLKFEKDRLLGHPHFKGYFQLKDESKLFLFDFNHISEDWDHLINGRYSQASLKTRKTILYFFEKGSGNFTYVESYLFPEKYMADYARLLDVDVKVLKQVGELCDKPDISREKFYI